MIRGTRSWFLLCLFCSLCPYADVFAEAIVIKGDKQTGDLLIPALIEAYAESGHSAEFEVELRDSAFAFKSLIGNRAQIGFSTRQLKASEQESFRRLEIDAEPHVAAVDFMVVIVNAANPATSLTKKQLQSAFAGTTSDWSRLGGDLVPVKVFTPLQDTETYDLFKQIALNRKSFAGGSKTFKNDEDISRNVRLQKGGIGFVGLASANGRGTKTLKIEGVEPAPENITAYSLSRKLYFYTIKQRATPETRAFVQWATTAPEAMKVVTTSGFVPATKDSQ